MKHTNRLVLASPALLLLALAGCGSDDPITNCLTASEAANMMATYTGYAECSSAGTIPGCGSTQIQDTDVPSNTYACTFHHNEVECGTDDSHACNVYGLLTGTLKFDAAGLCTDKCWEHGDVSVIDTGISCHTTSPASPSVSICTDHREDTPGNL